MSKFKMEQIKFIDEFLQQKGIKHLDVRVELLDHLATEFEENSNFGFLEDYLISKEIFIQDFAKKHKKTIHWSYQKQLWIQFFKFFYQIKLMLILFSLVLMGYTLIQFFSLETFSFICYFTLLITIIYPLFYQIKHSKAVKKVQSLQSLFSITALPSVFLYTFNVAKDTLIDNPILLVLYFSLSILLGISAIIIIEKDRVKLLEEYQQMVS